MKVSALVTDLMLYSRIESAARRADVELARVDVPDDIPPDAELVLVDWSSRGSGWAEVLASAPGRVILFGPHTDLSAHAAARSAGLGPMWARSRLLRDLPQILTDRST
jgi:hypothetical protein